MAIRTSGKRGLFEDTAETQIVPSPFPGIVRTVTKIEIVNLDAISHTFSVWTQDEDLIAGDDWQVKLRSDITLAAGESYTFAAPVDELRTNKQSIYTQMAEEKDTDLPIYRTAWLDSQ